MGAGARVGVPSEFPRRRLVSTSRKHPGAGIGLLGLPASSDTRTLDHATRAPLSHGVLSLRDRPGEAGVAILALVGEVDPLGTRRDGLDAFLHQKVEEGYMIETRTNTHAIISRRPKGLRRFTSGADPGRYVVEVDEDGVATIRPAEPRRT